MKSINFEFIRPHHEELAMLAGFAESYVHNDPSSALVKLRTFAEEFVRDLYFKLGLPEPVQSNLFDMTREISFKRSVPRVIQQKLDSLRVQGNKAAHGDKSSKSIAQWILKEAWDLSCWFYVAYCDGSQDKIPEYEEPAATATAEKESKQFLARLAEQEKQLQQILLELEETRKKADAADRAAANLEAAMANGQQVADSLHFNEAETRQRLIDSLLQAAGWKLGEAGTSSEEVGQEVEVPHQPTTTGKGYADYVLWGANGLPLAVIETKKTSKDANAGREQARLYADGLEKQSGQRPVIFYTNGFETYIWDDAVNETPRQIHGFYSRDSLEYLIFQRNNRKPLDEVAPDREIAGRMYQIETIRRVTERFSDGHRKALMVLATGTGKTRVAVSLCNLLLRAGWAKRILFLCDRRELRKQADNVFKEFLPSEPRIVVNSGTARDRDKRIYLATYPAMMKIYESFDVGFFDLIIADESHRSIYRRYRDLFLYFDSRQIGLTATPVHLVDRNTYHLFGCEVKDPTAHFDYKEATQHNPPYLAPFKVFKTDTKFQREGIKYSEMTQEQRQELEETEGDPQSVEFDAAQVDRQIFNKDTNREILRNLMEKGLRDETGSKPGKSIVFARNHRHAVLLQSLFNEMYPNLGGNFCRVIDNYDPRAEQLIDDFKGTGNNPGLTIAISVDMLDTGIDIPEVVNLVFAKPVRSYVKFWQMIGRGTRLCQDLFGPGEDKKEFYIFDHWRNFEYFEEDYRETDQAPPKSLLQRLFEARIELAEAALREQDAGTFDLAIELIRQDIADLPGDSLPVREKIREVQAAGQNERLKQFSAVTVNLLKSDIAPLMQWRDIKGQVEAYRFDLLTARMQIEKLRRSSKFDNLRNEAVNLIRQLPVNLNQVRPREALISEVKSDPYWQKAGVDEIESLRKDMRGIMQFANRSSATTPLPPKVIDVSEDVEQIKFQRHMPRLDGLQLVAYRRRVEEVLVEMIDGNSALQKIKAGRPVTSQEIEELCLLVSSLHPDVNLRELGIHYPEMADHLDIVIRTIIGMDAHEVNNRFDDFVHRHPMLTAKQLRFLSLLKNHLTRFGSIEIDRLYSPPFTTLDSEGIEGVFRDDSQVNELLDIISTFNPPE
ncbi:MAG: DEAD/DEAH box helicase family protein [Acidobacteriota bacterium]|nr:MAG: DEAD/DEAH box helicase family protein [Acidobacteriota bacterium]